MSDVIITPTLRCQCGESADTIVSGRPLCCNCAFELVGEPLVNMGTDARGLEPEDEAIRLAVVECRRCEGWMWAGLQDRCLGCGSTDLRVVTFI